MSDKTVVEGHGEPAPSEEFPEEGVCERSDCMKVRQGGHVGMEAETCTFDVRRDTRSGRHSRPVHTDSATKREITGRQL